MLVPGIGRTRLAFGLGLGIIVASIASSAFAATFSCDAAGVGFFNKAGGGPRIHLRCNAATPGGVVFFAMGTKNKTEAALALQMLTEAVAGARPVTVYYDPNDVSGTKIGCGSADCRLFQGVEMAP